MQNSRDLNVPTKFKKCSIYKDYEIDSNHQTRVAPRHSVCTRRGPDPTMEQRILGQHALEAGPTRRGAVWTTSTLSRINPGLVVVNLRFKHLTLVKRHKASNGHAKPSLSPCITLVHHSSPRAPSPKVSSLSPAHTQHPWNCLMGLLTLTHKPNPTCQRHGTISCPQLEGCTRICSPSLLPLFYVHVAPPPPTGWKKLSNLPLLPLSHLLLFIACRPLFSSSPGHRLITQCVLSAGVLTSPLLSSIQALSSCTFV